MNSKKLITLKVRADKYINILKKQNIKLNRRFRIQDLLNNVLDKINDENNKIIVKEEKKIKKLKNEVADKKFKLMFKKFKDIEKDIKKQNIKIEKKEKQLEQKFNVKVGMDYFIDVVIYKNLGKSIKSHYQIERDSKGNKYTVFKQNYRYQILNQNINSFQINKFYNEVDNRNDVAFCSSGEALPFRVLKSR